MSSVKHYIVIEKIPYTFEVGKSKLIQSPSFYTSLKLLSRCRVFTISDKL